MASLAGTAGQGCADRRKIKMNHMVFTMLNTVPTGDNFPFVTIGIVAGVAVIALIAMTIISKKKK